MFERGLKETIPERESLNPDEPWEVVKDAPIRQCA